MVAATTDGDSDLGRRWGCNMTLCIASAVRPACMLVQALPLPVLHMQLVVGRQLVCVPLRVDNARLHRKPARHNKQEQRIKKRGAVFNTARHRMPCSQQQLWVLPWLPLLRPFVFSHP